MIIYSDKKITLDKNLNVGKLNTSTILKWLVYTKPTHQGPSLWFCIGEGKLERYTIIHKNHQEVRKSTLGHWRLLYYYIIIVAIIMFPIDKPHQLYEPCPCPAESAVEKKAEKIRIIIKWWKYSNIYYLYYATL